MRRSILFPAFVSCAVAQQGDYRGDGGWHQEGDYRGDGGWGGQDNMYTDYAAKKDGKAVGGGGWGKLLLAGVGGYVLGAKIHTTRQKKNVPTLRFKLKQRVECNVGGTQWAKGTVVGLYSPQSQGGWLPYEILLDNGQKVFAPADEDMIIRAASKNKTPKKKKSKK